MSASPSTIAAAEIDEPEATSVPVAADDQADELVEADLLVEDVSIDGMCGVY
jgi:mycofactocin precursor